MDQTLPRRGARDSYSPQRSHSYDSLLLERVLWQQRYISAWNQGGADVSMHHGGDLTLTGPSYPLENTLAQVGEVPIKSIEVCRAPLNKSILKLANFVSSGKFDLQKKMLGYDELFHLYLHLILADGSSWDLEKEAQVILRPLHKISRGTECHKIMTAGDLTLGHLLQGAIQQLGERDTFTYDVQKHNCQEFVTAVLKAQGLLTPELDRFINQNANELLATLPQWAKSFVRAVPQVVGKVKHFIGLGESAGGNNFLYLQPNGEPTAVIKPGPLFRSHQALAIVQ